jgi:hypothetical protein
LLLQAAGIGSLYHILRRWLWVRFRRDDTGQTASDQIRFMLTETFGPFLMV